MGGTDSEKPNPNKKTAFYFANIIFLCMITALSLAAAVILFVRLERLRMEKEVEGKVYTDAQIEKIKYAAIEHREAAGVLDRLLTDRVRHLNEVLMAVDRTPLGEVTKDNFLTAISKARHSGAGPMLDNVRTGIFNSGGKLKNTIKTNFKVNALSYNHGTVAALALGKIYFYDQTFYGKNFKVANCDNCAKNIELISNNKAILLSPNKIQIASA